MNELILVTDGSVNTRSNVGYGAYLAVPDRGLSLDALDCEFVKVRGHQVGNQKDDMDRLFTLVDRASRNALRKGHG